MAKEVLGSLDPTSSEEQIQSALSTVVGIMTRGRTRDTDELLEASGLDLSKNADIDRFHNILIGSGLTPDQAESAILDVMNRRGIRLE